MNYVETTDLRQLYSRGHVGVWYDLQQDLDGQSVKCRPVVCHANRRRADFVPIIHYLSNQGQDTRSPQQQAAAAADSDPGA